MSLERHEIHAESVGAYLLGALEDVEAANFERHLEECPVCRDEVECLRPAADALPRSVAPVTAPPRLKTALMAAVEADLRARGDAPARPGLLERVRDRLASAGDAMAGMRPVALGMGAAFVLALGILGGYGITQVTSEDPSARTLAATVDERNVPRGSGSLLVPGEDHEGAILRVHGMPTLTRGSVYQVWIKRGGETVSQGLFSVGQDGNGTAAVSDDLGDADAVMITRETAGGAKAPTGDPLLTVRL